VTFDQAARQLGIPKDRVGLVKRNIELKTKLRDLGQAFLTIHEGYHEAGQHEGPYASCSHKMCAGVWEIFNATKAE
jgi:hypothetical protein